MNGNSVTVPTRSDVARLAGVSPAVVSYVVNDGPRGVAAPTRARVLEAISQLGYRPNSIARSLKVRSTKSLGLLVPDISNPYFAELARAVEDEAYSRGYALLLATSNNDLLRERAQLAALRDRQVDGLLLISAASGDHPAAEWRGAVPYVLLDRVLQLEGAASVVVDNVGGAREATRHLIDVHGFDVDCFAGPESIPAAIDREAGWQEAMTAAKRSTENRAHRGSFTRESGYDSLLRLASSRRLPRALFASSDLQAIGALRAANELGIRVPDDLAIVSFDGTRESEFTSPPLSVVKQPVVKVAEIAVERLLRPDQRSGERTVVPAELIMRGSCGCF